MGMIRIKKLNIIKDIDERDYQEWKQKGYKKIETDETDEGEQSDTDLFDEPKQSKFDDMSDEQLAEYAEQMGVDISRVRSRAAVIAKLEKAEQGAE